jgi:hypothetical protein
LLGGRSAGPFADVIAAMLMAWAGTGTTNPFGKVKSRYSERIRVSPVRSLFRVGGGGLVTEA